MNVGLQCSRGKGGAHEDGWTLRIKTKVVKVWSLDLDHDGTSANEECTDGDETHGGGTKGSGGLVSAVGSRRSGSTAGTGGTGC